MGVSFMPFCRFWTHDYSGAFDNWCGAAKPFFAIFVTYTTFFLKSICFIFGFIWWPIWLTFGVSKKNMHAFSEKYCFPKTKFDKCHFFCFKNRCPKSDCTYMLYILCEALWWLCGYTSTWGSLNEKCIFGCLGCQIKHLMH